jgi:RNA polymerase sigma factor, sigma-70 family
MGFDIKGGVEDVELTEIVRRCQLGDLHCFEELYKIHSKKALGTAYIISGNRGIAEDIVQEAFIICYKNINALKNPETFNIWFYKILIRVGWRMTSRFKNTECTNEITVGMSENSLRELADESNFEACNNRLIMREAIKKLKSPFKEVIMLCYFHEMSIKDISKVLGCRQGTVKSRLYKARMLLHKELNPCFDANLDCLEFYGREQKVNG